MLKKAVLFLMAVAVLLPCGAAEKVIKPCFARSIMLSENSETSEKSVACTESLLSSSFDAPGADSAFSVNKQIFLFIIITSIRFIDYRVFIAYQRASSA